MENRTGHEVAMTIRDAVTMQIERKIVEGALDVPLGPASAGAERSFALPPSASQELAGDVDVRGPVLTERRAAGVFRIGEGPMVLAAGKGRLFVRTKDGVDALEAEDPRELTVMPVERDVPPCSEGAFGASFDVLPTAFDELAVMSVMSVTRDAMGCRVFRIRDRDRAPGSDPGVNYRACVPDAAYPFVDTDVLHMRRVRPAVANGGGYAIRIESAAGDRVDLVAVRLFHGVTSTIEGIPIDFGEEPTCVRIEEAMCRDVLVPVKVAVRPDGAMTRVLAIGDTFSPAGDPARTLLLAGSYARPVLAVACETRPDELFDPARAFVAVVTRAAGP